MVEEPFLNFELVVPERRVLQSTPEMVVIPGSEGDFAALRGHAPMVSALRPGVVAVHATFDAEPDLYFVAGGFAEVGGEKCSILANSAVEAASMSETELAEEIRKAEGENEEKA